MKRKVFTSVTDSRNDIMKLCKDIQDFNEVLVPKTVKTSEQDKKLVQVDDIILHWNAMPHPGRGSTGGSLVAR